MKIYPDNAFAKFEFTTVKKWIYDSCISPMGKELVNQLSPTSSFATIQQQLKLTGEFMALLKTDLQLPIDGFLQVKPYLTLLEKDGYTAQPEQIIAIRTVVEAYKALRKFVNQQEESEEMDLPELQQLIYSCTYEKQILLLINEVLSSNGKVKDRASDVLYVIRMEQESTRKQLEKQFRQSLQHYRKLGYLADVQESVRHGKRVLAVKAEYKRKINGVIHDISETGQTAYIEPNNVLQLSNELSNLEQEERAEIHRIMRKLSDDLRPFLLPIYCYEDVLAKVDINRSKALISNKIDAIVPELLPQPEIDFRQAYHPVLKLQNQENEKHTQPLTIRLSKNENRIVVISGPNAGGKSVSLKTIGLLQLMIQSGIPIPVEEGSKVGLFSALFSEIGDEQSIENELSTYSSKLHHMSYFLNHVDDKSLFLIDEFGSGTDPSLGGAVAQSILEDLNNKKAFGIITTHYFNLKSFAEESEGVENAAMLFDEQTLRPLYQLEIGKPGSSYTFAIAQTSGLPHHIIKKAKQISSNEEVELDELLSTTQQSQSELLIKQLELEQKVRELERREKDLIDSKKNVKRQRSKYEINKKDEQLRIQSEVKKRFDEYVKKLDKVTNQQKGIDEIRASLKNELQTTKDDLNDKIRKSAKAKTKKSGKIEVGDQVKWIMNNEVGEVLDIKNNKAEVAMGMLKTTIPLTDLVLKGAETEQAKTKKRKSRKSSSKGHQTSQGDTFQFEIDIRGKRYEEAEQLLNDFFDRAILTNSKYVRVLHGKGSGVLREATAKIARTYKPESIGHPHPEEGGDGITIVEF